MRKIPARFSPRLMLELTSFSNSKLFDIDSECRVTLNPSGSPLTTTVTLITTDSIS